jgi:N6-adenosine-specific RNA methylase IME4
METALQLTLFDFEQKSLEELEGIIQRGLATFIEVGLSLLAIREGKKYRAAGYSDFEKYMEERWGIGKSHGWRMLNAGYIGSEISPIGEKIPTHESQVRPLARLGTWKEPAPERWAEAWADACDLAGEDRLPTEKEVKYVVDQMLYEEPPPIPIGEFRVIYADPPWEFDNSGFEQSAAAHYKTMPTMQIAMLEIPAAANAVCFMWATNAMLEDALEVMETWGFDYKSNFVWTKATGPTIGFYTTSRHELLLIGTKGQGMLPEVKPLSVIKGDVTEHSRKPEVVYDLIEKMYDGPYLELFARVTHSGWTSWGNEAGKFDVK